MLLQPLVQVLPPACPVLLPLLSPLLYTNLCWPWSPEAAAARERILCSEQHGQKKRGRQQHSFPACTQQVWRTHFVPIVHGRQGSIFVVAVFRQRNRRFCETILFRTVLTRD